MFRKTIILRLILKREEFTMSIDLVDGIVTGVTVGIVVILFENLREIITAEFDKRKIYNWLFEITQPEKKFTVGASGQYFKWRTALRIANFTNLTPERVNYICYKHPRIRRAQKKDLWPKDNCDLFLWGVKEIVDGEAPI